MRRGVGNGDGGNMGDGFDTAMLDVVSNKRAGSELEEECSAKGLEKRVKYDDVSYGDSKIQSVVKDAWEGDVGRPISSNITVCANNLSKWASEVSGDVKKKISLKEKELQDQEWQSRDPDVDMIENSKGIVKKLDELQRLDDSYLHAPSRVNEVKDGDKNTSNFHHKASYRQRRNFIHELEDNSGQMHDNEEEIAEIISGYFSNNFESSSPSDFQEATAGLDCLSLADLCVVDLIDHERHCWPWDIEASHQHLTVNDATIAQGIPLSLYNVSDSLYWWPATNGIYSTKSGYWLARMGHVRGWTERFGGDRAEIWNSIWNIGGPPNSVNFCGERVRSLWQCLVDCSKDMLGRMACVGSAKEGMAPLDLVIDDICSMSREFDSFDCVYIKRVGNCVAHLMARQYPPGGFEQLYVDNFPQGVVSLAELDVG
uniref:RNase H type-1 domain-containing protein n=1 Tax=Chenopodium quinoa TaxID=63459 RepID=A0A803KQ07_CHEQI